MSGGNITLIKQIKHSFFPIDEIIYTPNILFSPTHFHNMKLDYPLIGLVMRKCVYLSSANEDVVFCWVPGLTAIMDNEKVDLAPKSALDLPQTRLGLGIPYSDFKFHSNQCIFSTWQDDCNGALYNKPHYQASSGRLAVLLQTVQKRLGCVMSFSHQPFIYNSLFYLKERASTSVWVLSVYTDNVSHAGGMWSFQANKERYIWTPKSWCILCWGVVKHSFIPIQNIIMP